MRLLLRFDLYKTPKSGGAASIWRSACTRQNTVYGCGYMLYRYILFMFNSICFLQVILPPHKAGILNVMPFFGIFGQSQANTRILIIRAGFVRAEKTSTDNFGKIRAGEYSNLLRYKG